MVKVEEIERNSVVNGRRKQREGRIVNEGNEEENI